MSSAPSADTFFAEIDPSNMPEREFDAAVGAKVRDYLVATREYLGELHRSGAGGAAVNEANADAVDRLIRRLVRMAESLHYSQEGALGERLSIAAVGGYGRREMSVCSDVDILFLHGPELTPPQASLAERIQYWLWDARVAVGGAVRNIPETLALAVEDSTVATAVLDARFLGGDAELFHDFTETIRDEFLAKAGNFIVGQRDALIERHAKYGDSLYLLQPNVKEGAGGLRDYHVARWIARAAFRAVRGPGDFLHLGLLGEGEMDEYTDALDFLWRVRNELHLMSGRKSDQMSFEHQEQIASALGYAQVDEALPVEQFMGDYYRHARIIQSLSEVVIEQCVARTSGPAPPSREVADGFRVGNQRLEIPHAAHLRERPVRMLTAFAEAQRQQVPLSRMACRLIRENLDLVDDAFRCDPQASLVFQEILDAEHRVMRTLMAMNECGLLGRYLPEWGHIVCLWQHVIYHTYTVDVHSIFLVEELRRLWRGKVELILPELTELVRSVPDRSALFLGCLLHDIGKGRGGDHSGKGEVLARVCLERLGIAPERIDRICFLVRYHLLMSHISQRRDLGESKVIVEFARIVGDLENLRNLYLVTFADIRASSKDAWNEWKGRLLRELYEQAAEFLESGRDDPERALEQIDTRIETRREGAARELQALGVGAARVESYFRSMPRRYFVAHTPRQIARHARVVIGLGPDRLLNTAVREMRGGFSEFLFCSRDVHGLYADVAGSLTAVGINILGSHVYTTKDGLALEVYRVTTPAGGSEEKRGVWQRLESTLEAVLKGEKSVVDLMRGKRRPIGSTATPSKTPPSVSISTEDSNFFTVVDVSANDRFGLLYDLASTLAEHGLAIYISKATTILDQVADTFYVKDKEGRKVTEAVALEALQADLLAVTSREALDG